MATRTVLVTGGAGYIGSQACKVLAGAGYQPVTYDNLSRGHRAAVRWGPLEVGDLNDRERLRDVLGKHKPASVMHFAALTYVGESMENPELYHHNNVKGTLTLLDAMLEFGIRTLVFSSSCATYGNPLRLPLTEEHPQEPINPYGAGKLLVERALRQRDAAHGLRSVSLRYFNAAGADPDGDCGECHDPETHAVPLAIMAASGQGPPFRIFGTDYPTADGSAVRDYIHVLDLAEAHVAALDYLRKGGATGAFNLGTGVGTSVLQLIASVERVGGRAVPVSRDARRPGDPPVLVADGRRAATALDWRPRLRDIDDIVRTAWSWHCSEAARLSARVPSRSQRADATSGP
jgi:UDP-glucose-4-epimerase GalE